VPTLTTTIPSPNGRTVTPPQGGTRRPGLRPRRQVPWMVAGVVLVVGFALAFATVTVRSGGARQVLVVTRPVPAGHLLAAADLRSVRVSGPGAAGWLPAAVEATVVGRPVAVPLLAGAPLTAAELGAGNSLLTGQDTVAAALKAGQYPPTLAPGDRVAVIATGPPGGSPTGSGGTGSTTTGSLPGPLGATVTGVDPAPTGGDGVTVVSLQVGDADAATLARLGAAGQVVLVLRPTGAGG